MAVLSHTAMLWPLLVAVKHKVPFAPLVDIDLNLYHDLTSPTMLLDRNFARQLYSESPQ
jgi:hypothetical protein